MDDIKKRISIIAYSYASSKFYESQIKELFGDFVITSTYNVFDESFKSITNADLFVVTTTAFEKITFIKKYFPNHVPIVIISTTFIKNLLESLLSIPEDSKVYFVNISFKMVREAVTYLSQLGINHINFIPYYPGCEICEDDIETAVTPGEKSYLPKGIKTVIDIGHRVLDSTTVVEIALRLKLDYLLERENYKEYFRSITTNNYSFDQLFGRSLKMESQFEILMEIMDEGIIGVNENDIIFAYNNKASEITGISKERVLDQRHIPIFSYLPFEECKKNRYKINNKLIKINGVDINISVVPVIRGNKYMGAFATLQRFTEEETKQHNLRIQLLNKGHTAKYYFKDIIGESNSIRKACVIAKKMAKNNSPVLITGESGTGKELFAHAIHNESTRKNYPFIAINCAAMPDNLLESELFGYDEGAFTGARKGGKLGLFEFAHKGTLFLDEVEGMSPALQIKLLRVIQEKEIMRVGGNKIISIDVRIIAAANKNLQDLVSSGSFRIDLYYRLNTLPVELPPLRNRGNDILILFNYFKHKLGGTFTLSSEVTEIFLSHIWNGNIRELHNYVEYFIYIEKDIITIEDLPPSFNYNNKRLTGSLNHDKKSMLDISLLKQLAGNQLDDYIFVLEKLYDGFLNQIPVGRISIAKKAEAVGRYLTQQEIRNILNNLNNLGLIKISKGRGGSKIYDRGIKVFNELNK